MPPDFSVPGWGMAHVNVAPAAKALYLDANATTAALPSVIAAVSECMKSGVGNPSSAHRNGAVARRSLETARDSVASLIGWVDVEGIVFVSGGTEANNAAINSFLRTDACAFLVAPVEHPSLIEPLRARCPDRIAWLDVDSQGRIEPGSAADAAKASTGPLALLLQAVNSETGVIQPVREVIEAVRAVRPDAFVHLDAAQAVGRIPLGEWTSSVDTLAFSGHKIHGPAGTGVLAVRDGAHVRPFMLGGGQERGLRSGTPNVPGIVGLGVAAHVRTATFEKSNEDMRRLRDRFEKTVLEALSGRVQVNGGGAARVSNTSNLCFDGIDGMQLLAQLDATGVMASQGSACSSGRPEPSRVLLAMGLSEREAFSSLRFSFSILNSEDEADEAARITTSVVRRFGR